MQPKNWYRREERWKDVERKVERNWGDEVVFVVLVQKGVQVPE